MLKRLFQRAWGALVTVAKFTRKCLNNVSDAMGLSAIPLHVVRHDASLAHACKVAAPHIASNSNLCAVGVVAKSLAAKASAFALKMGLAKVSGFLGQVAAMSSLPVGILVVGLALCILFIGAVRALKRIVKKASEFIETLSDAEDTEVIVGDFGFAT